MAMNSAEAHRMLKVSMDYPRQVAQIVPSPRTFAIDRTIIEMMGKGYIGDLISVDARVNTGSAFPKNDSPMHWRFSREFSGNNIMAMILLPENSREKRQCIGESFLGNALPVLTRASTEIKSPIYPLPIISIMVRSMAKVRGDGTICATWRG